MRARGRMGGNLLPTDSPDPLSIGSPVRLWATMANSTEREVEFRSKLFKLVGHVLDTTTN